MKGSGSNVDAAADVERARLIGGVDTSPGSPRGAADFGAAYPAWCVHLLTVVTLLALCSHYIPTEWLRDPTPVRVAAIEHELPAVGFAHSTFATPSKLPHPDVMEEVFDTVHEDLGCMRAPKEWGKPTRVSVSELIVTDPPLIVYQDVLVARDPVCARLTRAHHVPVKKGAQGGGGGGGGAAGLAADGRADDDRVVWTTHLNRGRMGRLMDLDKRWGGCLSVALWLCQPEDWEYVAGLHAKEAFGAHVTFHAVLGHGAYPYNLQRNVALAPFAPWATGNGRPAPWVVVADADGVPSVGESQLAQRLVDAASGNLANPPIVTGEVPPELAWMGSGALGLSKLTPPAEAVADDPNPAVCDAWDGRPHPFQCKMSGHPSGLGWARRGSTAAWATERSRCGRPVDPARAFFVIPSFDSLRDNGEQIRRLRDIPPDADPSVAFAYLRKLWDHRAIEVQAQEAYAPSYEAMVPWSAWLSERPAGLLAVHYSFIYEPYIAAKAPFPSSSLDKWEPFDEFFRAAGFDKCIFFVETAGLPWHDPGKYYLHVLPQVFLLNDNSASSPGPKESRHLNWQRFMDAAGEHGAWCQDLCPCVPFENRSVAPPWGFHEGRRRLEGGGAGDEGEKEREHRVEAYLDYLSRRALA